MKSTECGELVGVDRTALIDHLYKCKRAHKSIPQTKRRQFLKARHYIVKLSWNDVDWPTSDKDSRLHVYKFGKNNRPLQVKNLITGEIYVFDRVSDIAPRLGLNNGRTFRKWINSKNRPFGHYLIRDYSEDPWETSVPPTVLPDKKRAHRRCTYVKVTTKGETKTYDNIVDVAAVYGVKYHTLYYFLRKNGYYDKDDLHFSTR